MTDNQIMDSFRRRFNPGRLLTEEHVLKLMSIARIEGRNELRNKLPNMADLESEFEACYEKFEQRDPDSLLKRAARSAFILGAATVIKRLKEGKTANG